MVLYEIYREDGGNRITFVHMLYIDTGSSMPISPSKSRDLADGNKKKFTE